LRDRLNDEQSVMMSDRVFQARGPETANAVSPSVHGTSRYRHQQQGRWRRWPQSTSWSDFSDS